MARLTSNGAWKPYKYLMLIDDCLLNIIHGSLRRLIITIPPRHGKSQLMSRYFPAWYLGNFPDRRVILASYEANFAAYWGGKARDELREHAGHFVSSGVGDKDSASWWSTIRGGEMMTAGVGGAITGKGANLFVIDDPVKNSEEANSPLMRDKAWDWYLSVAESRLEPDAAIVIMMTRWHEDDLAGRLVRSMLDGGDRWEILNLPAIAERDEQYEDSAGALIFSRKRGDALCPDRFPLSVLEVTRRRSAYWFGSLYQGNPIPREGGLFLRSNFPILPTPLMVLRRTVRYWDLAARTTNTAKRTAGVRVSRHADNTFAVEHVVKGKWNPAERDDIIVQTAQSDGARVEIVIEVEPGSGGISQVDYLIRRLALAGFRAHGDPAIKDKEVRAGPASSFSKSKGISVVSGEWNGDFFDEANVFPFGKYLDQVDAFAAAFNWLADKTIHIPPPVKSLEEIEEERYSRAEILSPIADARCVRRGDGKKFLDYS